ncbi:MAG: hypothetical protein ACRD2A_01680 [Vicinamibacterales bacterium]
MTQQASKLQIDERDIEDVTVLVLTGEITLDDGDLVFEEASGCPGGEGTDQDPDLSAA